MTLRVPLLTAVAIAMLGSGVAGAQAPATRGSGQLWHSMAPMKGGRVLTFGKSKTGRLFTNPFQISSQSQLAANPFGLPALQAARAASSLDGSAPVVTATAPVVDSTAPVVSSPAAMPSPEAPMSASSTVIPSTGPVIAPASVVIAPPPYRPPPRSPYRPHPRPPF